VTVHIKIISHSGFTTPPTVEVVSEPQQTVLQGRPERPTLRLVR
jgi:hypothetical protein